MTEGLRFSEANGGVVVDGRVEERERERRERRGERRERREERVINLLAEVCAEKEEGRTISSDVVEERRGGDGDGEGKGFRRARRR